jgi:hypothetical protein
MTNRQARTAIAVLRLAVGTGTLLAPRVTGRLLGLDPDANAGLPYVARMFGVRELYMAAPALLDPAGDHAEAHRRGIAVDVVDSLAALAGVARGQLPKRMLALAVGGGAVAAWLGTVAARPD